MPLRRLILAHRALLLVLVALAMVARVAVPAGWMPMAGADGTTRLVPCSGSGPVDVAGMAGMAGMAMHASPADGRHDPAAPAAEHECPWSVAALAADLAAPPIAPAPPGFAPLATAAPSPALLPGRGLAAPPPPATGPPAFA